MKLPLCFACCLLTGSFVFADDKPQFEIAARYEGFTPSPKAEVEPDDQPEPPGTSRLSTPRVITPAGQRATIEVVREVPVPGGTEDGKPTVNSGVTLSVSPDFKDGKITLEGHSTVRHQLQPGDQQPLGAVSFSTHETFFSGEVVDGKPFVIHVGEGAADPSKVTLTVTSVPPRRHTARGEVPTYRFYAIEPSSEEAKKSIYQSLQLVPPTAPPADSNAAQVNARLDDSLRANGYTLGGVFDLEGLHPAKERLWSQLKDSLREVPAGELPIKVSTTLDPDGEILDLKIDPTSKGAHQVSTDVSVYWGSDVLVYLADAGSANARRGLLIHQE